VANSRVPEVDDWRLVSSEEFNTRKEILGLLVPQFYSTYFDVLGQHQCDHRLVAFDVRLPAIVQAHIPSAASKDVVD